MKKHFSFTFFGALLVLFYSCRQEENLLPSRGKVTFPLSKATRSNGRTTQNANPAFALLSIQDDKDTVREHIKLPLFAFAQGYLSKNLEIQTGHYQLTQFAILDITHKVNFATPLEGAYLATYVTDPLPIEFTISPEATT